MNIEKMQVAIRPMTTYQAIDLGMVVARHWFLSLWLIWLGMALPILLCFLLLMLLVSEDFFAITIMVLFWLKPIFEKPLVLWISRALFAEEMPILTTIKQGWRLAAKDLILLLITHRISTKRQIMLPILVLEQPDKKLFKQRLNLILRGQTGNIGLHSVVFAQIESVFCLGVMVFLMQMIDLPSTSYLFIYDNPYWNWFSFTLLTVIYFLVMSLIAPFFIAGGFVIYLTKRCLLEGWDIELVFKQLNQRFLKSKKTLVA